MKAIFISFNQAYYEAIVSIMDRNNRKGFTIVEDEKVDHFLEILHNLDKETEAQGLRAFVWNIEKTI